MRNIAVCIPTIRDMRPFMKAWQPLFNKHDVELLVVYDGDIPKVRNETVNTLMGKYKDCITNFNGGVRNLGFAYIAKFLPDVEYIITLDDDEVPIGDPIQDHLDALSRRVPVSWISTATDEYMRGFPYGIRDEAEVVLSHGVWEGVADWDAPTQLVKGSHREVEFPKMPIPKGIYFPMCIMNVGFKRKMLPWMFQAPPAPDMNIGRTDDIFCGILAKREIDKQGWAAVTGFARVRHERASNVYANLNVEAKTIELMETFWQGDETHPYFKLYRKKLALWQQFMKTTSL